MRPAKKFLKSVKKDAKSKRGIANALRFASVFAATFLVFVYAVIPMTSPFWLGMGNFHAGAAGSILSSVFGLESAVDGNVITMPIDGDNVDFEITQLCSGDIEIALLASLLIASIDVLFIWRVLGALLGAGLLLLLNPLRIALTLWITKSAGMETGDAYHSLIFRLFLFVILVLYYFAWYRLFAKRKSRIQEKICNNLFGKKTGQKHEKP